MKKIYLSYANEDFAAAKEVKEALEGSGMRVTLVEHVELTVDGDVAEKMLAEIKEANVFLCLFSGHANLSNFVSIEINAAVKREKEIYVLALDESKMEPKLKFALANSTYLKGGKAVKEFIKLVQEGEHHA